MYLKAGWLAGVCLGRLGTFRTGALTVSLESGPYELEPSSRGRAGSALPNLQKLQPYLPNAMDRNVHVNVAMSSPSSLD